MSKIREDEIFSLKEILDEAASDSREFIHDLLRIIDYIPWISALSLFLTIVVTFYLLLTFKPVSYQDWVFILFAPNLPLLAIALGSFQQYRYLKRKYSRLAVIIEELHEE